MPKSSACVSSSRRICRADLASSVIYVAETGPTFPATLRGALDLLSDMVKDGAMNEDLVKLLVAAYRKGNQKARDIVLSQEKLGFAPSENYYGVNSK